MSTLAKFMILSGGENHPPMLEKHLYDSWKSRMELYMQNREHGRMILESVEHGSLIWPTIEKNGLPSHVYSLVNHHRVSKDLWERVQLLILPPEWSKFVIDVKLIRDLHTTNFDQLNAYLEQHELHANEVCIMRERNQDPLALVANHQMTPSHFNTYQTSTTNPQESSFAAGTSGTRANISRIGGNNSGQQRVVKCFNCQGDVHMERQCPKPKRKRDATCQGEVDVLSEVPHSEITHNDMLNQSVQEMQYSEQTHLINYPENEMTSDSNIIPYSHVIAKETNVISIADSKETLMLEEESRSKMLLKQSDPKVLEKKVNIKPINYAELNRLSEDFGKRFVPQQELSNEQAFRLKKLKYHLGQFDNVVKKRITPDALTKGEWGFEHTKAVFLKEIIPFVKTLKDIFNVFDKDLLNEVTEVQTVFNQMEAASTISYIVNIVVNSSLDINTSANVNSSVAMNDFVNLCEMSTSVPNFEAELIKQHNMVEKDEYNRLSKSFFKLEQHCISLELAMQLNKEIFQKNNTYVNQTEPSFDQLFELNNLKAELQAKDKTIKKLKANIKRLNKTSTTNNVKKDIDEIETINIELEHRVTKLIAKNEHLKQAYKQLYDSIKPSHVRAKEHTKLKIKGKDIVDNAAQVSKATTIAPGMYKLDPVTLAPKDKNKRKTTYTPLRHTIEQAVILREIVEQAKSPNFRYSMFDARYELCFLEFVSDMNASSKSKPVKKFKKKEEWKPTGKVFTKIGYQWRPTGRTFNLVGNVRPKVPKSVQNSKPKVAKSMTTNRMEPGTSRGSDTSVAPSSSSHIN
ncbi:retrovirus-related pol polyprotein from transposon TNT 1-94 [Tanacetum coccineum]